MRILVSRVTDMINCTESEVFLDGQHFCYGLEPPAESLDGGPVCIPQGTYEVWLRWSQTHRRWVPAVMDVHGHSDIEIHTGNWPKDTKGCLLVGMQRAPGAVTQSSIALADLMGRLLSLCVAMLPQQPVTIQYKDTYKGQQVGRA